MAKVFAPKIKHKKYPEFDDLTEGDNIKVYCQHEGCNHFLAMKVNYTSTMELFHPASNTSFDMRNQVWYCHQHKTQQQ